MKLFLAKRSESERQYLILFLSNLTDVFLAASLIAQIAFHPIDFVAKLRPTGFLDHRVFRFVHTEPSNQCVAYFGVIMLAPIAQKFQERSCNG